MERKIVADVHMGVEVSLYTSFKTENFKMVELSAKMR